MAILDYLQTFNIQTVQIYFIGLTATSFGDNDSSGQTKQYKTLNS